LHQPLSAIETFTFRGRTFYVKRDDSIDPLLSGNKYRKLYTLIKTPSQKYSKILSYGGTQSNAMLSIAALCHQKGWEFHYTAKRIPSSLKSDPTGNLRLALSLGMQLHEVMPDDYDEAVASLRSEPYDAQTLLISQGGADPLAEEGIALLAEEIALWQEEEGRSKLTVVTPSGTGTTAFYLASYLPHSHVVTTPLIGDRRYLQDQIEKLGRLPENLKIFESRKKYHFGKPYGEFLRIYEELKESGMLFDLLYGAKMWYVLMESLSEIEGEILYVHSGGLIGNETMLPRYAYKGF